MTKYGCVVALWVKSYFYSGNKELYELVVPSSWHTREPSWHTIRQKHVATKREFGLQCLNTLVLMIFIPISECLSCFKYVIEQCSSAPKES